MRKFSGVLAAILLVGGCKTGAKEAAPSLPDSPAAVEPTGTTEQPPAPEPVDEAEEDTEAGADDSGAELETPKEESKAAEPPPPPTADRQPSPSKPADKRSKQAPGNMALGVMSGPTGGGGAAIGYGVGRGAAIAAPRTPDPESNTEDYTHYGVNDMTNPAEDNMSTFAVDVDTASYTIARRKISDGQLPPSASVRVEEWVNYFNYDYPSPTGGAPFSVHMDAAPSPFHQERWLVRVGVQARKPDAAQRKKAHLVFLVDVSGSMHSPDKLPLAKRTLRMLVDHLHDGDTVAMVTYAGNTRVVLEPTGMQHKARIHSAIEELSAGGSTAMASGIDLAYKLAAQNLADDAETRVIILSDGDANVGPSSHEDMLKLIAGKVKMNITLSVVGFGMGNYKDTTMEQFANKGNGNYYYIDGPAQAQRVFVEQLGGTLETVAKDVKLQVVWDKDVVAGYRLVGYENRDVRDEDFRNDAVDAGEIGAGHQVTAFYEVQFKGKAAAPCRVHIRAKQPRGDKATEQAFAFDAGRLYASFDAAPADFRFGVSVMASAEILRGSPYAAGWKLEKVSGIAARAAAKGDRDRTLFVALLERVRGLQGGGRVAALPE